MGTKIEIVDILGRVYVDDTMTRNELDVSHLSNGLYYVKYTEQGTSHALKFVKQ